MRFALHLIAIALLAGASRHAAAQTTDGYSSLQIVPVVVDTASFAQRFNFHNPNQSGIEIIPEYYPAVGTTGVHITCPGVSMAESSEKVFTSLRALCPALAPGAQFGFLYLRHLGPKTWTVFTRVTNPQGAGFAVEGFPASTFTSAEGQIVGIRRLAATANSPAYQTNCFIANLPVYSGKVPQQSAPIAYYLYDSAGQDIGSGQLSVAQGSMVRLLDVFAAAGLPPGNYDDAMVNFVESDGYNPGVIKFCTVQDNTSFGADFRIGKMVLPTSSSAYPMDIVPGAQDQHAARGIYMDHDDLWRNFTIPAGDFNNIHLLPVRLPDYFRCELLKDNVPMTPADGLEMRVVNREGETLLGGNNSTVVPDLQKEQPDSPYLGDKDLAPTNATWFLQVESNGQNTQVDRHYTLHCVSGSGMGLPNLTRYQAAGTEF